MNILLIPFQSIDSNRYTLAAFISVENLSVISIYFSGSIRTVLLLSCYIYNQTLTIAINTIQAIRSPKIGILNYNTNSNNGGFRVTLIESTTSFGDNIFIAYSNYNLIEAIYDLILAVVLAIIKVLN